MCRWHWCIEILKFNEDYDNEVFLQLFCLWIRLFNSKSPVKDPDGMLDRWGFDFDFEYGYLKLSWANSYKYLHFPWAWDYCESYSMLINGQFEIQPEPANIYKKEFSYTYTLKNGTIQLRTATVKVEKLIWCWRNEISRYFRWPNKVRTSIDFEFNHEVGERTDSWKGGVISSGYSLLPNETPEQCLRRMEKEMRFD